MTKPDLKLLNYFDETAKELMMSNRSHSVTFSKKAELVIAKYNDNDLELRKKLALADVNFVPELQQKILLELQGLKHKIVGIPDMESDIYLKCKIKIDRDATLEELVKRGKYVYTGRNFTTEKYPKPTWEADELELLIIPFGELSTPPYESVVKKVTEKFGHLGRFAGIYDLAHLGWQHPNVQERFIELYGIGSHVHTREHTWAHSMPVWRAPMLTYGYEQDGPKVRGFYTKDEGNMFYNHDFCMAGFVIVKTIEKK